MKVLQGLRRLLWIYAAYLAVVVLVLMPLANALLPTLVQQQTGRTLRFDLLVVNPLSLDVTLHNASLADPDGEGFFRFDRLSVNISLLQSLALRHLVLDALELRELHVLVRRDSSGHFNFADILDHRKAMADPEPDQAQADGEGELPALTVRRMVFSAERLGYREQRSEGAPFESAVQDIALVLKDFSTFREEGKPYRFAASEPGGGQLLWEGDLSVAGAYSSGRLRLQSIALAPAYQYFAPRLGFTARSALLDIDAYYRLDWKQQPRLRLHDTSVALRDVDLRSHVDPDTGLQLGRLGLGGLSLDSVAATVDAATLDIQDLHLRGHSSAGDTSLQPMFAIQLPPPDPADDRQPGPEWRLSIDRVSLDDSRIDWRASELAEPLAIVAEASLQQLHWPATQPAQLDAQLTLNGTASIAIGGPVRADGSQLELNGELAGLPLSWANPILGDFIEAQLRGGVLNSQWRLLVTDSAPQRLELARGGIAGLELQVEPGQADPGAALLAWESLDWSGVAVDIAGRKLLIDKLELERPRARLAIHSDGSTNVGRLLVEPAGQDAAPSAPAAGAAEESKAGSKAESEPAAVPWDAVVHSVNVIDGELDFSDANLALPFRTRIQAFNGHISDLDSSAGTPARVDLAGTVDGYAPVSLRGTVQPLAAPPALDLTFDFSNLDLTSLTPYSGTYAGYALQKGLLSVTLSYSLENNRIHGNNRVVIDQLQLGEPIESPKAIDLPLRLAIALLKDSRGVIDLGVEVSGDIDDPQFELGKVIWAAFRNLLVKAVQAPFKLLAGLVGSDHPLDHIAFQPGSSEPGSEAEQVLDKLVEALQQRPSLRVALIGQVNDADVQRLAEIRLDRALLDQGLAPEALEARGEDWREAVEEYYARQLPSGTEGDAGMMHRALLAVTAPDPAQLDSLASERAQHIKRALVIERGLPAERVFLQRAETVPGDRAAVELEVAP